MSVFSAVKKKTEQASSGSAMSIMCSKCGVLSIFPMKHWVLFSRFSTWNSPKTLTHTPSPLSVCFREPQFLRKYVNGGLCVSTEANIASPSCSLLSLPNSTALLEAQVWKLSSPARPRWAFLIISTQFHLVSPPWSPLLLKTQQSMLPFSGPFGKSRHSSVMVGMFMLMSGKLGFSLDHFMAPPLGESSLSLLLGRKFITFSFRSDIPWFCKHYYLWLCTNKSPLFLPSFKDFFMTASAQNNSFQKLASKVVTL